MGVSRRQKLALKRSTAPINIWHGSVRSSKTFASLWDFIKVMSQRTIEDDNEGVVLVVGYSTNNVWRNLFVPLLTAPEFAAFAPYVEYRQNAPSGKFFGQPFSVVGANNEASWLSIQGLTVAYCLGDEATGWPKSFWEMLLTRLSLAHSRLLVTCNPGGSNHYLKKVIDRAGADPDVHTEKFLLHENPTLPQNVVARLKRSFSGLFYRRMILGEWVAAEGAVYESWDPGVMVVPADQVPEDAQVLAVGLDYGTDHPSAGYALSLVDGTLWVTHEWAPRLEGGGGRKRMTDYELADSFEGFLASLPNPPRFVYADPAGASFREELRRRRIMTYRADNSVVDGINTVNSVLTGGMLKVSDSCPQLIKMIPDYRWDQKAAERGKTAPIKEDDDEVDALRYTVYSSRHIWSRAIDWTVPQLPTEPVG